VFGRLEKTAAFLARETALRRRKPARWRSAPGRTPRLLPRRSV